MAIEFFPHLSVERRFGSFKSCATIHIVTISKASMTSTVEKYMFYLLIF